MITTRSFAMLGVLLALGLTIFGFQIGIAVKNGRDFDRYFTVRGLSERTVKATLAIWPIRYAVAAEDLPALQREMEKGRQTILNYLKRAGLTESEYSFGLPQIVDRANERREKDQLPIPRYSAVMTIVVRSTHIDSVKAAIQKSDELLAQDVALVADDYGPRVQFLYEEVNAIKPALIAEATANARKAAEKFAQDSHARVGKIRKATQGLVEITDRDIATPEVKVVRVVTTIDFFIE